MDLVLTNSGCVCVILVFTSFLTWFKFSILTSRILILIKLVDINIFKLRRRVFYYLSSYSLFDNAIIWYYFHYHLHIYRIVSLVLIDLNVYLKRFAYSAWTH